MALVVTPGAADADSYITTQDATTYLAKVHTSTELGQWSKILEGDREALLRSATTLLDTEFKWVGWPTYPETQALQHPRVGLVDRMGNAVDSDIILPEVAEATAELALWLLTNKPMETIGPFKSLRVGNTLSISFADTTTVKPPRRVFDLISPWATYVAKTPSTVARLLRC